MAKSVSVRFSDAEHKALEAKAEELDKTPQELIKEALEVYGALAPDEGFNLKLRAHLREILGFSSPDGLEAFIVSCIEGKDRALESMAQTGKAIVTAIQTMPVATNPPTRRRKIKDNPEIEKLILDMAKDRKTPLEIAQATGYPASTITSYLSRKRAIKD